MKKIIKVFKIQLMLLLLISFALYAKDDNKSGRNGLSKVNQTYKVNAATGKVGDAYRLNINNINLPMNSKGVIADVDIEDPNPLISGEWGKFAGNVFLFSSGFFLSGYANGNLFANAVASASLVEDYLPGTVAGGQADPRAQIYVLKAGDEPFGQSWLDWVDAVALGADYYDGNNDGEYNPVDLNGNGTWDPDEDRPDLIGDETVWCVYNDALPQGQRRWNTVAPLGIEVRQTVFAFASSGAIGNIIFVRYRIKYVGKGSAEEADRLEDCYFGVWADTDLGDANDDLVGSDIERNAGYTYNDGDDNTYGSQPPTFLIDFFSGPVGYLPGETFTDNNGNGEYDEGVDIPLDTAYSFRGQIKGVETYPGARNLGISSFVQYINSSPVISDPNNDEEARNYMLGLTSDGTVIDPCTWTLGEVRGGVNCANVNDILWYNGDPVNDVGWINSVPGDARMMQNSGPFTIHKGEEKEIVVAYVVGQGSNALNSISVARNIDDGAQVIFDNNFLAPSPPPAPEVSVQTGDDYIDLVWETSEQLEYHNQSSTYDLQFRGFNVYAYQTASTQEEIEGRPNKTLVTTYQLDDNIVNLYAQNGATGGIELQYPNSPNRLDPEIYADPETGRIRVRITQDPFTGRELVKGKPYYFAVTSYAINHDALLFRSDTSDHSGTTGDYYLSSNTFVQTTENVENIIDYNRSSGIIVGEDMYASQSQDAEHTEGASDASVSYSVAYEDRTTDHEYQIGFTRDTDSREYKLFYNITDLSTGSVVIDSIPTFDEPAVSYVADGVVPEVEWIEPDFGMEFENGLGEWFSPEEAAGEFGVFYIGGDYSDPNGKPNAINAVGSSVTGLTDARRVELRFGVPGKAYRYVRGLTVRFTYPDANGFVDVPFQAWVVDEKYGEEYQLAVAFTESENNNDTLSAPDGIWNPFTNVLGSKEYIIIFDEPYDPNGGNVVYTGTSNRRADIRNGYQLNDPSATPEQLEIARSAFFDGLYAVGLNRLNDSEPFNPSGTLNIELDAYPLTPADKYVYQVDGNLTEDVKKDMFEKVNVFPNPLYGFNPATSYTNVQSDEPFVTFSNLPEDITIKIFSLSGTLLRTLTSADKNSQTSPFLRWNLQNESGLRVASGLYLAIVSSPLYGEKVLKFSIIMPQKQILRY